jgi:hypothetical protein
LGIGCRRRCHRASIHLSTPAPTQLKEGDEVSIKHKDVQTAVLDFGRFAKMLTLKAFLPVWLQEFNFLTRL